MPIINGGFETGDFTGWNEYFINGSPTSSVNETAKHGGNYGWYLHAHGDNATQTAESQSRGQTFTISEQDDILTFWLNVSGTFTGCGGTYFDFWILDELDNALLWWSLFDDYPENVPGCVTPGWVKKDIDISSLSPGTYAFRLNIGAYIDDNYGAWDIPGTSDTTIFVDGVGTSSLNPTDNDYFINGSFDTGDSSDWVIAGLVTIGEYGRDLYSAELYAGSDGSWSSLIQEGMRVRPTRKIKFDYKVTGNPQTAEYIVKAYFTDGELGETQYIVLDLPKTTDWQTLIDGEQWYSVDFPFTIDVHYVNFKLDVVRTGTPGSVSLVVDNFEIADAVIPTIASTGSPSISLYPGAGV
jgi:hypothetical protein